MEGNNIMEALLIIGFVALVGYVCYQWACYERMNGQIYRIAKDNSKDNHKIIMNEINKNK